MKQILIIMLCYNSVEITKAQNGVWGQMGLYGASYNAATTISNGGSILVSSNNTSSGVWQMGGNITSEDKNNTNSNSTVATTETITFDGFGSIVNTNAGATYNIDGYAATTNNISSDFILPLGNGTNSYPFIVPANTSISMAYVEGLGTNIPNVTVNDVTGSNNLATVFSHYYDFPNGLTAGNYTLGYPADLITGKNAILKSQDGTMFNFLTDISDISLAGGNTGSISLPNLSATRLYLSTFELPLPITIVSFRGSSSINGNLLNWTATNAVNFNKFELQRKTNNQSAFQKISTISFINNQQEYSFLDNSVEENAYYRLALVNLDGTISYSSIVYLSRMSTKYFSVNNIYPIPTLKILNVSLNNPANTKVNFTIVDVSGKVIWDKEFIYGQTGQTYIQSLDLSNIVAGTYFLKIGSPNGNQIIKKFLKL